MMRCFAALLCALVWLALPALAQEATEAPPTEDTQPTEPQITGDIPEAMPLVDEGGYDIINILLTGHTTGNNSSNPGLTDSLMIVSVNKTIGSVAVVSIPRDLWVYMPDTGMVKINQVYFFAEREEAGSGFAALKATIQYNLGVVVDYYARVNFDSFSALINSVGGIEISVDCAIQDWRLKEPDLDVSNPDNWEMYTLPVGRHTLRGSMALWYVRSRRTSNDIDRGRRQQDVLRALYRKIRAQGLLENFPVLWEQLNQIVVTDITLPTALHLLPVALNTDTADIQYFTFRLTQEVNNGFSDDEGRFILEPNREAIAVLMQQVVLPPTASQSRRQLPTVAVVNASGIDGLAMVTADRLELEGFRAIILDEPGSRRAYNYVIDYTGLDKSNPIESIKDVLSIADSEVEVMPDPQRQYDYMVYIGSEYPTFSCTRPVEPPREIVVEEATPEPGAAAGG